MIKYEYAKNEFDKLIHISSINSENRKQYKFKCISCENELRPRLGKIRAKHFFHLNQTVNCSDETYLHRLGKHLFLTTYQKCVNKKIPFVIEILQHTKCNHYQSILNTTCNIDVITETFNLIDNFELIKYEPRVDQFIPDLVLSSANHNVKIFIEIAVTHKSTDEKVNSNYRIIEIQAKNEDDFNVILGRHLSYKHKNVRFIKFKDTKEAYSYCKGNCEFKFNLITLEMNGKLEIKDLTLSDISKNLPYLNTLQTYLINQDSFINFRKQYITAVFQLLKKSFRINTCLLCEHHSINKNFSSYRDRIRNPIYCNKHQEKCHFHKAITCGDYSIGKNPQKSLYMLIKNDKPIKY